uniref:TonB-dependent receptor domain-containing protein n=1 Tax=Luteimonas aquatica TaxID=450364 RepID=UPI001F5624C1
GSSAIAGVVNIILKKHIDGTNLNFRFGTYDEGGGGNARLQLTGGKTFGNLDLTYGLQFSKQDPIYGYQRDRMDSTEDNPNPNARYGTRNFLRYDASLNRNSYIDPGAACDGIANLDSGTIIREFRPNQGYYCGSRSDVGLSTIMNKKRDVSGYLNANYALNDTTDLYATVLVGHNKAESSSGLQAYQPAYDYNSVFYNQNSGLYETWQRIFTREEAGGLNANNSTTTSDSYNIAIGAKGAFGASNWNYDAFYNRSQYKVEDSQLWILKAAADRFFEGRVLGPQLGFTSDDYPIYAPNEAAFYRPITPSEYRGISDFIRSDSEAWTQNVNVQVNNSELFNLPAGPVGFAAVLQAGNQSWENPVDPRLSNGDFWGRTGTQGAGKRSSQALGVEFRVPILSTLTSSLSGRYDHYSNKGGGSDSDFTYKVGLEFRPVESLLLRANYATAFKAPDMGYTFAGEAGFFPSAGVIDYYRCATEDPGVPPEQCVFSEENFFGRRAGSKELKSITAKSWGLGVVWAPSADFDVSADYYSVKIDDEVNDLSVDTLLRTESACRLGQLDPASPTCADALSRITRLPVNSPTPNQLDEIRINPINISKEEVRGIISKLNYRWETEQWGKFALNATYNVSLKHESQQYPGDPTIDLLNDPFYSSEFRNVGSGSLTWMTGPWTATVYGIRYGSTPNYAAQLSPDGYAAANAGKVGAWVKFNTSVSYDFSDDVTVSFTVNNLANKMPPRDRTWTDYPYYNNFNYNPYGRSFLLELNWRLGASTQ